MTAQSPRLRLVRHLTDAAEKLAGLETNIGDHPAEEPPILVDQLSETLLDAIGRIEDSLVIAHRCADDGTMEAARAILPMIQESIHRALFDHLLTLAAPKLGSELSRIARIRGGEWAAWVHVIRPALADSVSVLEPVYAAIGECWTEVCGRSAPLASSVHQVVNICHRDPSLSPSNLEPQPSKS